MANAARHDVLNGAFAGLAGGLAASWIMRRFVDLSMRGRHDAAQERSEEQKATELIATRLAARVLRRTLTREELRLAAPAVRYVFGGGMGALYGALVDAAGASLLTGAAWGVLLWIGGDRFAMPRLSRSSRAAVCTPGASARTFASHVVYGMSAELVRRRVRATLETRAG